MQMATEHLKGVWSALGVLQVQNTHLILKVQYET